MSTIKALAYAAFIVAIPLFLIITNLRVVVNTPLLYSYGFDQYEIERVTGIERAELISAGRQIRDYFSNEERWLDVKVRIDGTVYSLYNETEILHMYDVKVLIRTLYNVQLIAGLYILLFIPVGLAIAPRTFPRVLVRLVLWGAAATLAIVFAAGLLSLTGFSQTFYVFHLIAFTNDLWKLDPARDFLIAMFPEGFFFDTTMVLAGLTVIQGLWLLFLSNAFLKAFPASVFHRVTIIQTLTVVVAAIFILRVYPDGFFFEAVMIVVVASVLQTLLALVTWRRAPKDAVSATTMDDGKEPRLSAATSKSTHARETGNQNASQLRSERAESLANNVVVGYNVIEAVLFLLTPSVRQWRGSRRDEASSDSAVT